VRRRIVFLLAHLTDTITTFITNLYATTGLAGIVLAMAIESCCIPLPSEIVMPLAGVMIARGTLLSGVNPLLSLVLVALAGATGCLIGSIAAYGIGYAGGRPLLLKYGRYVLISQHDADKADLFFQRWGSSTVFFSRLLPVVRTYISLPAGIAKMPLVRFCVFTFLGSFPWCMMLAYIGYVLSKLGQNLSSSLLSSAFHVLDVVIVVAFVALVALYIWRHIRNDRKARAEHAAAAVEQQQASQKQDGWMQPSQQQQGRKSQLGQSQQPSWSQDQSQQPQWGRVKSPPQQQPWPPQSENNGWDGQQR
jgi:membrane protein DedA with SNARE-associated domain